MRRIVAFVMCGFLFAGLAAAQERKELGLLVTENIPEMPERIAARMNQYQNTRAAAIADWDPSGAGMLITTRFAETLQLHYLAAPGAYRKQMTFFSEPVSFAQYSPVEPGFVFSMDEGGGEFFQLFWFDLKNGSYHRLTSGGRTVNHSFVWSNKGDRSAFSSTRRNSKDFDLYVMEGTRPEGIRLLKTVEGEWDPVDWSSDDSRILVAHYISANEVHLYAVDSSTGEAKEINPSKDKKIAYGASVFARDRNGVYYSSDEDSEFQRLTYYDLGTGKKEILADHPWDVDSIAVSRDGKWLSYSTNEGGLSRLYVASTSDLRRPRVVDLPVGVVSDLRFDYKSGKLGFNFNSARTPSDVFSYDLKSGTIERWTYSEVGGLNAEVFVSPTLIEYPTFDEVNGKPRKIPAFYYKPSGEAKKPYPVFVSIHGGPEAQAFATFNSMYQYLLNELGVAVLVPNVRGSSGYGKSYLQLDNGMKREDTVRDIGSLLDWIKTQPELDGSRVAVYGGSYGGYMSLASLTHYSDRIRCGIDVVGISNFVTFLESTEEYRRDLRRPEYGDERDPKMREFLDSISPTTNAAKVKSPLFVIQGQNDPRVPMSESEQMVKTIRAQGGNVWYLMAKDEGHGFKKKGNRDYMLNAITLFLEENLLKNGTEQADR